MDMKNSIFYIYFSLYLIRIYIQNEIVAIFLMFKIDMKLIGYSRCKVTLRLKYETCLIALIYLYVCILRHSLTLEN